MKTLLRILVVIGILLAVLVLARNTLLKTAAQKAIEKNTGFGLAIDRISVGLVRPVFKLQGLELQNPEDFPEREAFLIKELLVRYDLPSFFGPEIHLPEVVLDIPKAIMVKKDDGESNIDRLRTASGKKEKAETAGAADEPEENPTAQDEEKPAKKIRIDRLHLVIGSVDVREYTKGVDKPKVKTYDINVDRVFTNVTDLKQIGLVISAEIVTQLAPKLIEDFNKAAESGEFDKAGKQFEKAAKDLKKSFEGMIKSMEKSKAGN